MLLWTMVGLFYNSYEQFISSQLVCWAVNVGLTRTANFTLWCHSINENSKSRGHNFIIVASIYFCGDGTSSSGFYVHEKSKRMNCSLVGTQFLIGALDFLNRVDLHGIEFSLWTFEGMVLSESISLMHIF